MQSRFINCTWPDDQQLQTATAPAPGPAPAPASAPAPAPSPSPPATPNGICSSQKAAERHNNKLKFDVDG